MSQRNPEFQRQLWLNWRPSLLAWSLGLSLLILALPFALSSAKGLPGTLSMTAIAGLYLAAIIYGSVLAGRSLAEEASQNTWDWQRLSVLTPWQMAGESCWAPPCLPGSMCCGLRWPWRV